MKNLKLFFWDGVLTDYESGIMFALAPTVEEARKMILEKYKDISIPEADLRQDPEIYEKPFAIALWGSA